MYKLSDDGFTVVTVGEPDRTSNPRFFTYKEKNMCDLGINFLQTEVVHYARIINMHNASDLDKLCAKAVFNQLTYWIHKKLGIATKVEYTNYNAPIWKSANGPIVIRDMTVSHLEGAIEWLKSDCCLKYMTQKVRTEQLKNLDAELCKRQIVAVLCKNTLPGNYGKTAQPAPAAKTELPKCKLKGDCDSILYSIISIDYVQKVATLVNSLEYVEQVKGNYLNTKLVPFARLVKVYNIAALLDTNY
jgi:hypothetical protein